MNPDDRTYTDSLALNNRTCQKLLRYLNNRAEGTAAPDRYSDRLLQHLFAECMTANGAHHVFYNEDEDAPALLPGAPRVPLLPGRRERAWLAAALDEPAAEAFLGAELHQKLKQALPAGEDAPLRGAVTDHSGTAPRKYPALADALAFFAGCACEKRFFRAVNRTPAGPRTLEGRAYFLQYDRMLGALYVIGWSSENGLPFQARLDRLEQYETISGEGMCAPDDLLTEYEGQRTSFVAEIRNHRNAVHRFCGMFGGYERQADFSSDEGIVRIRVFYYSFEQAKIVRWLLSLGPSVTVLEPPDLRRQMYEAACGALAAMRPPEGENKSVQKNHTVCGTV